MATLRQTFSDIASAIRAKGVSGTMKPIEMASKIGEIQTGGGSEDYGYLTFTAQGPLTIKLMKEGSISSQNLLKSTDGVNWTKWENPSTNGISISAGKSVYLKAAEDASNRTGKDNWNYNYFYLTIPTECSGDIRSIINPIIPADYNSLFQNLFLSCNYLVTSPELKATNLVYSCYQGMFTGCTYLTQAPELPATNLADNCYYNMFTGCTSLTQAPELPATNLAQYCYSHMFEGCTSLTQAPELPATNLLANCYDSMFYDCTSLTTPPELPATNLSYQCYNDMFYNCTSLATPPELPATNLQYGCYQEMFDGCTSLTQAPELPATYLEDYCYTNMFYGCTSLNRIKMNASSGNWGEQMFYGCTSLELVDMTGSTGVPQLSNVNNFDNTNYTYKIVVPDSLYDTWVNETNWAYIADHIMKQSDWNNEHPDDILGQQ